MSSFNYNSVVVGRDQDITESTLIASFVRIEFSDGSRETGRILQESPSGLFFQRFCYKDTKWQSVWGQTFYPWHYINSITATEDPFDDDSE